MATMGLRRRVPPVPSTSSGKRGRSDNNNSPSQGNLNKSSPEPPAPKKTRSSSRPQANKSLKELDLKKMASAGPPLWSDPRPYASIAGLSIEAQRALCAEGLASPMYMSPAMATFVGAAAAGLGKVAPNAVSTYLDISNMTSAAAVAAAGRWPASATTATSSTPADEPVGSKGPPSEGALPATFPDDGMFGAYQPWVIKTYGDLAKTKTITIKKYGRILRTLRGEEANSAENSKFRFWVKSKGFHIGQPEGYEPKPADRIVGRHAVTAPGLDPPLYVPTQPPHNKASSSSSDGSASTGRIYKKVAIVENFFDIIHAVHVDLEGRPGKHAGQKRTYRTITETYAFLPREAVTRFLLGCTECQRRPRTPSPTSLAAVATATATTTATKNDIPTISRTPTPTTPIDSPPSPKPATTLANSSTPTPDDADKPKEASDPPETGSPSNENSQDQPKAEIKLETEEPAKTTTTAVTETTEATTTTTVKTENIDGDATTTGATSETDNSSNVSVAKIKAEKYNPLSITNLLRKDPVSRRPPIALVPKSESALSTAAITATTTTTSTTTICPSVTESSLPVAGDCPVAKCAPMDYSWAGDEVSRDFLPAAGLIGQNLNLLATIQQLHCQVMLALTQRLRPSEPSHGSPPSAARNNAEEPGS